MMNLTQPFNRTRNKSYDALLPISAPPASSSSPFKYAGIALASLLLLGCGAAVTVRNSVGGASSAAVREVSSHATTVEAVGRKLAAVEDPEFLDGAVPAKAVVAPAAAPCQDTAKRCGEWTAQGECQRNPQFMHKECAASCGMCEGGSAVLQQPASALTAMSPPAGNRTPVVNQQELKCFAWAMAGECQKNPAYMHATCKDACDKNKNKEEA